MQQRTGTPIRSQPSLAELYQRHVITLLNYIQRMSYVGVCSTIFVLNAVRVRT